MPDTPQNDKKPAIPKWLALVITLSALAIALVHIRWPDLPIDAITLGLIVIAVVPWLAPYFKSLEFPGGLKVELRERLEKAANLAEQAGILAPPANIAVTAHASASPILYSDPNLALAALRIEIEKRLRTLAEKNNLPIKNLSKMLYDLTERNVLGKDAYYALQDMIKVLNRAVHGARVNPDAAHFANTIGPRLLKHLDDLANEPPRQPAP